MDKIAAILAVVDPTAAEQPAVAKAALLAKRFDARLELLACATAKGAPAGGSAAPGCDPAGASLLLEALAAPLQARGMTVTTHALAGAPLHEALLARLHDAPVDLVVKDTHPHPLPKRALFTHTDWHLIRGCRQPLLLAKPRPWAARPVILAAVDPGHAGDPAAALDQRILQFGASFAARLDGELHAANAYFPATIATAAGAGIPPAVGVSPEALRAENERHCADVASLAAPHGVTAARLHVAAGTARDYLPRVAAEIGADLVVMGAIARSGLKRVLLGSTAERVLELLPCDVLVVKSADFAAALPF